MSQSYPTESPPRFSDQVQPTIAAHPQRLFLLTALCIVGQGILLASAWLLPLMSEYSLVSDTISELVLGAYGFVQTAAFVISGLGVLGLAYALCLQTKGTWGSLAGSLLVAIYGLGAILSAVFPTDRIDSSADITSLSTTGTIHSLVALVSFLCIVAGMVVLAWTFSRARHWRTLTPWAAILATAAVSLLIAQVDAQQGPWVGIMQRSLVTVIAVWLILVALRVRAIAAAAAMST